MIVGQGPIALEIGAGGGGLDIFTLLYPFSTLSPSLWEIPVLVPGKNRPDVCLCVT